MSPIRAERRSKLQESHPRRPLERQTGHANVESGDKIRVLVGTLDRTPLRLSLALLLRVHGQGKVDDPKEKDGVQEQHAQLVRKEGEVDECRGQEHGPVLHEHLPELVRDLPARGVEAAAS